MTGCVGCGSAAVSERNERTAQGYRRFRCRACGKQFNERSAGVLNRTQYPSRRHRPRGALAAALQAQPARPAGDVPDPRHRVQSRGGPRLGSQAHAGVGRRSAASPTRQGRPELVRRNLHQGLNRRPKSSSKRIVEDRPDRSALRRACRMMIRLFGYPALLSADAAADRRVREGPGLRLAANARSMLVRGDVERLTGWVLKPEGMCRDALYVPLPDPVSAAGRVDLAAFWRHLGNPVLANAAAEVWVLGAGAEDCRKRTVGRPTDRGCLWEGAQSAAKIRLLRLVDLKCCRRSSRCATDRLLGEFVWGAAAAWPRPPPTSGFTQHCFVCLLLADRRANVAVHHMQVARFCVDLGYQKANRSPILRLFLSRIDDLIARVAHETRATSVKSNPLPHGSDG